LDLILVSQHLGESGTPGWIREDVNKDGYVDVLDLTIVGQHMGETTNTYGEESLLNERVVKEENNILENTTVTLIPENTTVSVGDGLSVAVEIDPAAAIAGAAIDLSFDPAILEVKSVTEGNLLKQNGCPTYFLAGDIDNNGGTVSGVSGTIATPGEEVAEEGTFITVTLTAKAAGNTELLLEQVIVGDKEGRPISFIINNCSVAVQ